MARKAWKEHESPSQVKYFEFSPSNVAASTKCVYA